MTRLLKLWSPTGLADLFEAARSRLLREHPLFTAARVARAAEAFAAGGMREVMEAARKQVRDPDTMAAYLRTTLLHGLSVRLRRLVAHVGHAEDRRLLSHVRLPLQFGETDDIVTVCEAGAGGDGTIRAAVDAWPRLQELWQEGFLSACPSAAEDAAVERFWAARDQHPAWRIMDPRDPAALAAIAEGIGSPAGEPPPARVQQVLFGREAVGAEAFELYYLAVDIEAVRQGVVARLGRPALDWEIASAAAAAAEAGDAPELARLLAAYGGLEDAGDGSLSPQARLAEQAYRLGAPLCVDGCRACVHQESNLMGGTLAEATLSRRLLACFEV